MTDDGPRGPVDWLRWFWTTDHEAVIYVREVVSSVGVVVLIGLILFGISGLWPPMVAVESGSMEPHMERGDLVFVMEEQRLSPDYAVEGVVTYRIGKDQDYRSFGSYGDVIVYRPGGSPYETPIIHRARLWVEEGENWYPRANQSYITADSCRDLQYCPAPHSGFITKGDNAATNRHYDQSAGTDLSPPVKPSWVVGTAELGIPYLGYVKLVATGSATPAEAVGAAPGISATIPDPSTTSPPETMGDARNSSIPPA